MVRAWAVPGLDIVRTERLTLRRWREADREPFAAMNADPEVMEFFPARLTADQSDAFVDRIEACFDERGYGLWVVEPDGEGFAGYVGLWPAEFDAPFTPTVAIGWRLARWAWGHAYAPEAARRVLGFGLEERALGPGRDEIVSF